MIKDIEQAVINKLDSLYPDHDIYAENMEQSFERSCFVVRVLPSQSRWITPVMRESTPQVVVSFYPTDDSYAEMYDVCDMLQYHFQTIENDGLTIMIESIDTEIVDDVLHMTLNTNIVALYEDRSAGQYEPMCDIYINEIEIKEG
ncbi:DUF6838 family protein [Paenibacillus alvei]|uniref:phage tail terminator family protein n=1 Tax=Paenibacillus alvei TaxID=44250 RepID=UPI002280AA60|nr:hypothetical protein [Paenibacillus alvei]MCY7486042.1 hypothetical protein [Paenibacillus alvei]